MQDAGRVKGDARVGQFETGKRNESFDNSLTQAGLSMSLADFWRSNFWNADVGVVERGDSPGFALKHQDCGQDAFTHGGGLPILARTDFVTGHLPINVGDRNFGCQKSDGVVQLLQLTIAKDGLVNRDVCASIAGRPRQCMPRMLMKSAFSVKWEA